MNENDTFEASGRGGGQIDWVKGAGLRIEVRGGVAHLSLAKPFVLLDADDLQWLQDVAIPGVLAALGDTP